MTLMKTESIGFYGSSSGADISLRRFFRTFGQVQRFQIEVLFDPDSTEIQISIPYNEVEDEDRGIISRERAEDTVAVHLGGPFGYYQNYYVMGSRPSGTAPDRFWVFDLVRDPFYWLQGTQEHPLGRWSATQRPNDSGLTFAVESDAMKPSRTVRIPHLDGMFFVKISSTEYLNWQGNIVTKVENTPTTYMGLVVAGLYEHVRHDASTNYLSIGDIIGDLDEMGTDPQGHKIGLTPSSIVDISISERAPTGLSVSRQDHDILQPDGKGYEFHVWGGLNAGLNQRVGWFSSVQEENMTWPALSDMEYHTGAVSVYDSNDARVSSVPVQIMKEASTVKVRSIMDLTGIITELQLPGGSRIVIPEGKLPYVGSAWSEYAVAQRSYDRENMTLAIQNAKSEATQNTMMGIANGVLTGGLIGGPLGAVGGVASAGLNVAGTALELQRSERTARAQQGIQEKMIANSVGTSYNTGYGTDYIRRCTMGACRFQVDTPAHLTQARYDSYVQEHGYPDSGVEHAQNLFALGYVQGYVTDPSIAKYHRDEMNRQLTEGVRFI